MGEEERAHLAAQRVSRIREVQGGALGWARVALIDVQCFEANALGLSLELFGLRVERLHVGQARHLIAALQEPAADYVLLACHGDEGRVVMPELGEEVERFQPVHGAWGPDEVRRFARLAGATVIATGCQTGSRELAEAFLDVGAASYVGPQGAPFGYASLLAPLLIFYELTEGRSLPEAVARLRAHDAELAMWRLFSREKP